MIQCIAVPGDRHIIDTLTTNDAGELVGRISGETAAKIAERRPGAVVCDLGEFAARVEAMDVSEPEPITAEDWDEALNCLPPMRWRTVNGVELFQCIERWSGRVTATYARIGSRYWTWKDLDCRPHVELADKAVRALRAIEPLTPTT